VDDLGPAEIARLLAWRVPLAVVCHTTKANDDATVLQGSIWIVELRPDRAHLGPEPGRYGELPFRLRRHWAGVSHAQLFWRSESQPGFSEGRSALIALDGPPGEWCEYSIRLDDHTVVSNWRSEKIVQLRFDPSDVPGRIDLGPLVLREN
jgi:hypothetical protein